jgi:hypothetical protein
MSNLLEQASLVMIPSGYKEDVVYSQIPLDGSGDMNLTRASNGTRINSAGLVEVVAWNLAGYSEDFSNAAWSKANTTITANDTTAPNGTTTADKFAPNGTLSSTYFSISQEVVSGATSQAHTAIIYAKAGGLTQMLMYLGNSIGVYWNLSNGQFISYYSGAQTITNYSSEAMGDGWYKYTISISANSGSTYLEVYGAKSGAFIGNYTTSDNCFVWGAQLNIGSTAKPYFPTTDRLNVPRLTYQNGGGGCPSLLLEKQSTNKIIQSQNFTSSWFFANLLYTANQAISPDGTQNATKLDNTTGTGQHRFFQQAFTGLTNETISFSIYAKQGTHRYISWGITDDSDYRGQVVVDLQTGTITDQFTASATLSNLSVVSQGNGWYRISGTVAVSANYAGGSGYAFGLMLNSASWSTAGYTGTETYFYGWGAQAELSTYPTSYIPTTSSSATRVADACFKTGISSLIGQTEGVVFYDGYLGNEASEIYAFLQQTLGNTITSSMYLQYTGGQITWLGWDSSTNQQWAIGGGGYTLGQRIKIAGAYKANDIVLYVNGTQIGTDTSATVPTCTALQLGLYPALPSDNVYRISKPINQVILFKTRLTNAELASLTTI